MIYEPPFLLEEFMRAEQFHLGLLFSFHLSECLSAIDSQLLAAESKIHDTKEGSLSSFQESPLQWKANDDGFVKIMDMHRSLYQSRIENQLNQRNMNQIDETDENEEENQIELSIIPVQTSSKKISDEESAMWF